VQEQEPFVVAEQVLVPFVAVEEHQVVPKAVVEHFAYFNLLFSSSSFTR